MVLVKLLRGMGAFVGSLVLLVMRLYWGYQFFQAGWAKFGDLAGTTASFEGLGIPQAEQMAQLVAYVETIGGLLLLFGLLSRLAALPLIIVMITAYFTAHFEAVKSIFFNPEVFMDEKPFMFLLTALLVFSFGAGWFSLDHYFTRSRNNKGISPKEKIKED